MDWVALILNVLLFVWDLLKEWLFLFISPIRKLEILWIIVPIWLSWFFSEFFQEKKGTSFGNAISNGVVPFFVGLDWARFITNSLKDGTSAFSYIIVIKYFFCLLVVLYGISIIILGIKATKFVQFYGRIRETTYILLVFSPIIYGIVDISWKFLFTTILFFPLFYYLVELIDRIVPDPKIYEYNEVKSKDSLSSSEFNQNNGFDNKNFKF
jgi:hypothetical protein